MISRATALRLTAAIVAIFAIAVVASVLPSVIEQSGGGGLSDGGGSQTNVSIAPSPGDPGDALFLTVIVAALVGVFVVATVWMVLYDRRGLLSVLKRIAGVAFVVAVILAVATAFMEPQELESAGNITGMSGGTGSGEAAIDPGSAGESNGDSSLLNVSNVLLVAGVLLALAAIGYVLKRRLDRNDEEESESLPEVTSAEEVAVVAGATADRIQAGADAPVENEVYRAWKRMTELLDVENQATSTPGEFAGAAIDAGFDPADVGELTSLFEAVRYGPTEASELEAERAVDTLRRIESSAGAADRTEVAPGETE